MISRNYVSLTPGTKYLITALQTGDATMTCGNPENMVESKKFQKIVETKDLPHLIRFLREPFWQHPLVNDDTTDEECEAIPFSEKKWGIYTELQIEPLSSVSVVPKKESV